jgi:hypothetical protein
MGALKLLIWILTLIMFILLVLEARAYSYGHHWWGFYSGDLFLLLVIYSHLHTVGLMLFTSLFSLSTASLLPKMSFDFIFHFVAFILYMVSGLWVLIGAVNERPSSVVTIASIALVTGCLHIIHGFLSYRASLN